MLEFFLFNYFSELGFSSMDPPRMINEGFKFWFAFLEGWAYSKKSMGFLKTGLIYLSPLKFVFHINAYFRNVQIVPSLASGSHLKLLPDFC